MRRGLFGLVKVEKHIYVKRCKTRQNIRLVGCYKEMREQALNWRGVPSGDPAPYVTHVSLNLHSALPWCTIPVHFNCSAAPQYQPTYSAAALLSTLLCYCVFKTPFYNTVLHFNNLQSTPLLQMCNNVHEAVWVSLNFIPAHQSTIMLL